MSDICLPIVSFSLIVLLTGVLSFILGTKFIHIEYKVLIGNLIKILESNNINYKKSLRDLLYKNGEKHE